MENKVLQVFFGQDLLPYKDKERTIHFPVTGSSFAGSNNTKTIRFYVDQIGGTNGVSWVVVSKLPNGKVGYEPISSVGTDTLVGEKYLSFDLSSYYTQVKGIVKLALRGYSGEIQFVDEDDTGIYQIVGDPLIEVTGTIDFAINYSPLGNTGNEMLPSDVDRILASLSGYIKNGDGIIELSNTSADISDFDEGQLFVIKTYNNYAFYYKNNGLLVPFQGLTLSDGSGTGGVSFFNNEITIYNGSAAELSLNNSGCGLNVPFKATSLTSQKGTDASLTLQQNSYTNNYARLHIYGGGNNEPGTLGITFDNSTNPIQFWDDSSVVCDYLVPYNYDTQKLALPNETGTLATQSYVQTQIAALGNVFKYKGTKTVSELNALTGQQIGDTYNVSDSGTLNAGNVEVIAGDNVAWNGTAWDKLAGTIDLSGYLQKTSSANKVYGTNDQGAQTLYTVDDFYDGNIARRDSDGSLTVPLTPSSNGEATSKKYVDDLFNSISYDDALSSSSTNAVQNKVITQHVLDLQYRVSLLEEAIISEDTLSYTYLSESLIPQVSDNSYPIIQGAGLDTKEIKGRSFASNQILQNGNFASDDGWSKQNATLSVSSNIGTMLASAQYGQIRHEVANIVSGHKYLISLYIKTTTATTSILTSFYSGSNYNNKNIISTTNKQLLQYLVTPTQSGTYILMIRDDRASGWDNIEISDIMVFDLTQSSIDSATTVDQAIALLQQNGINPYQYNEYNVGKIIDSKPVAIVSKGFNVWDEEWEQGSISSDGTNGASTTEIRSKGYISALPNQEYYFKSSSYLFIHYYDSNYNHISYTGVDNTTKTTPINCAFIRFRTSGNGGTYNNDICINLSSSLNGTYKPYKAPITYPLSVPVMRSARSVQDNNEKVNVGFVDLGTLNWTYVASWGSTSAFICQSTISNIKTPADNNSTFVGLSARYNIYPTNTIYGNLSGNNALGITYQGVLVVRNDSYTDADTFKTAMSGVMLNYELANQTDQPTITLPENIEIELGGSLEVLYDDGHTTPCDFTFDTAVYKPIQ